MNHKTQPQGIPADSYRSISALVLLATSGSPSGLARGMNESWPVSDRAIGVTSFMLENPELVKLWIYDVISGDDVRQRYTQWYALGEGLRERFSDQSPAEATTPRSIATSC